jgi:cytochrome c oxidase subunit 4
MSLGHVVPVRTYVLICAALLGLTWLTVQVAFVDLGAMSTLVAMAIACLKATLVILYFMHARYSGWLVGVSVLAGVLFIGILVVLTLSDYMTRGWL